MSSQSPQALEFGFGKFPIRAENRRVLTRAQPWIAWALLFFLPFIAQLIQPELSIHCRGDIRIDVRLWMAAESPCEFLSAGPQASYPLLPMELMTIQIQPRESAAPFGHKAANQDLSRRPDIMFSVHWNESGWNEANCSWRCMVGQPAT